MGTAWSPSEPVSHPTEAACRQACCDAVVCDGYAFDAAFARNMGYGDCYLYANLTQLSPSSGMASGVRESVLL